MTALQNLSVKKTGDFLNKWGFKLSISRSPYSEQSTYKIVDKSTKQVIFIGNYTHFLKILSSLTIIYEKMLDDVAKEEKEKRGAA